MGFTFYGNSETFFNSVMSYDENGRERNYSAIKKW